MRTDNNEMVDSIAYKPIIIMDSRISYVQYS